MRGILLNHLDGIPDVNKEQFFILRIENNDLSIDFVKLGFLKHSVQETRKIKLSNVYKITLTTLKEIEENKKDIDNSIVGRGIGGALIFGPIGAVLGGMSAIVSKNKPVLVITYLSSSAEIKNIVLCPYSTHQSGLRNQYRKEFKKIETLEKSEELKKAMRKYQGIDEAGYL